MPKFLVISKSIKTGTPKNTYFQLLLSLCVTEEKVVPAYNDRFLSLATFTLLRKQYDRKFLVNYFSVVNKMGWKRMGSMQTLM